MRLPFAGQPPEARFFLLILGWAGALGIVYWFVSREVAGTALLVGLALASGLISIWLVRARRQTRRRASAGATSVVDRPFLDESGRLPDPTLAPFAVGLGIALAVLGPVFGFAPVAVGVVSLLWGASMWLSAARDELDAEGVEENDP
jgi:Cytochrome c oxidase subunit IV